MKNKIDRNINGIILIDKPTGLSSNRVLNIVKNILNIKKASHSGTLDPIATGMLPILIGKATKFSQYLLDSNKRYRVTARLGIRTNSADSEGKIINVRPVLFNHRKLIEILKKFIGNIYQIPPMFSAIKYKGCPLYKYARKGIEIPSRKARLICVYELKLIKWNLKEIELEILCSKGTYIRTIIDDLGEKLNCGAHVKNLHRISVSTFSDKKMITIAELKEIIANVNNIKKIEKIILPIESSVIEFPELNISLENLEKLKCGNSIQLSSLKEGLVRLTYGIKKKFFGVGKIKKNGILFPKHIIL